MRIFLLAAEPSRSVVCRARPFGMRFLFLATNFVAASNLFRSMSQAGTLTCWWWLTIEKLFSMFQALNNVLKHRHWLSGGPSLRVVSKMTVCNYDAYRDGMDGFESALKHFYTLLYRVHVHETRGEDLRFENWGQSSSLKNSTTHFLHLLC